MSADIEIVREQLLKFHSCYLPLAILSHPHSLYHHSDNLNIQSTAKLMLSIKDTISVAAHMLPPEHIANAIVTAALSTGDTAVRLIASDYIREQSIAAPSDLLQQCGAISLTNSLPSALLEYAAVQSIIPGSSSYAVTGFYVLAKTSLDIIYCYNDYRLSGLVTGVAAEAGGYVVDCVNGIASYMQESFNYGVSSFDQMVGDVQNYFD